MATFAALLRAVNVGGTGKLAMADLVKICKKAGFSNVKTYIQSGNVVFDADAPEEQIKGALESALTSKLGKPVGVFLRRAEDLQNILAKNPFKNAPPNRVIVVFMNDASTTKTLDDIKRPDGEELVLLGRELFIYYPNGQGRSKLKIPFAESGTGRNINTVSKLAALMRKP